MSRLAARGAVVVSLVLASSVASAQGAAGGAPGQNSPAAGGAAPGSPGGAPDPAEQPEPPEAPKRPAAGYAFSDKKPAATGKRARAVKRTSGPVAMYPGFEALPGGGSRVFVVLSQKTAVEERKTQGGLTYVLKGAHVRHRNNTNALVTVHFDTPVSRAKLVRAGADLHLVIDLRAAATATWKTVDAEDGTSTLQIDFPKGDYLGAAAPEATERAAEQAAGKKPARNGSTPTAPPAEPGPTP